MTRAVDADYFRVIRIKSNTIVSNLQLESSGIHRDSYQNFTRLCVFD